LDRVTTRFYRLPSGNAALVRRVALLGGVVALAGCGDDQSTLSPESHAARSVATMWWVLFVASAVVVGVVTLLVLLTLLKRRGRLDRVDRSDSPGATTAVLVSGAVVPAAVLVALFVYVLTSLGATAQPRGGTAFRIEVVGKQWFWAVRYPEQHITTANEIHVPVGVPVEVVARTADVIHSFWVPRLNRKIDMIPGRRNKLRIEADRAGVYRGQCAEFCGLQHANMAFYVIAQPRREFERWVDREQRQPRRGAPGERVFVDTGCGGCHTIRGVSNGRIGPDLTHLASRMTLAAGTIPNRKGYLGGWILDPQHVKPGNKMPGLPLRGRDLQQLLDYLESLR
jgi:cytochrome c oxidase subunit II